jgi:predicted nucleotidyltransferase
MKNMNKRQIQRELKTIIKQLVGKYQPEKLILFGSYVWGKPQKGSDLDLFIIKKGVEKQRHIERLWGVIDLVDYRKIGVDILIYTPSEVKKRLRLGDPFVKKIIEEGEVVYG